LACLRGFWSKHEPADGQDTMALAMTFFPEGLGLARTMGLG